MKKIFLILTVTILSFTLLACQSNADKTDSNNGGQKELEGSLEDILDEIYETADLDSNFKDYIKDGLELKDITEENIDYHLGTSIEYESAIASVPIMMPSAYELCLVRVKEGADIEKIKSDIKENADPMKWICVGVDPSNVVVDNIGNTVILIMSDDHVEPLHEAFLALKK